MPGKRLLLDTNAIIQLLAGNEELLEIAEQADFVSTSIICELEFLSIPGISNEDIELYQRFRSRIHVFGLPENDPGLSSRICGIRFSSGLKLPDAIIAGTAIQNDCLVVTADAHFNKLKEPWHVLTYTPQILA
jgi:tRNA(fMet)-specific endonuclease VapC